jgi:hypothetical protein
VFVRRELAHGGQMKITSFYYLAYPDCSPPDPMMAASEVYVEVAIQDGSMDCFDFTYSLTICTIGFLKHYLEANPYYAARSLVIVKRFDDQVITEALESILPYMEELAAKK